MKEKIKITSYWKSIIDDVIFYQIPLMQAVKKANKAFGIKGKINNTIYKGYNSENNLEYRKTLLQELKNESNNIINKIAEIQ